MGRATHILKMRRVRRMLTVNGGSHSWVPKCRLVSPIPEGAFVILHIADVTSFTMGWHEAYLDPARVLLIFHAGDRHLAQDPFGGTASFCASTIALPISALQGRLLGK